ncbi:MAG: ABC transporter ATP-binding protein [Ignavibacteria bacterium]|jgi:ABC-type bacteriocin/lantibiotic exporter with double-glycine peptidase domain
MEILRFIKNAFKQKNIRSEIEEEYFSNDGQSSINLRLIKKLFPFVKLKWRKGVFASSLLVFSILVTLPQPLMTKFLIDDVLLKGDIHLLTIIIIALVLLFLFQALFTFLRDYYFTRFEQEIILEIQRQLFKRVLWLPKSFFDNKETGYLMSRLTGDTSRLQLFFSSVTVEIFTNLLKFIGGLIILFMLHWKLTLLAIIIIPFFFIVSFKMGKTTHRLSFQMLEKSAQVSKNLQSSISGVTLIKSFTAEAEETKKITSSMEESMNANVEQTVISSISQLVIGLVSSFAGAFILWYGATEVFAGRFTIGSLVAFNSYLAYLYSPTRFWASAHIRFQSAFAALQRVLTIFELISEDENDKDKKKVSKLDGRITFENVSFSYNNDSAILRNISFNVNPGEKIAIVGPTGAGKSTLVNLILRLYKQGEGKISFDGMDADDLRIRSLRERIGVVSQEIFLFNNSIMENIRYGRPEASDDDVYDSARMAHAHEFIKELPGSYETTVGERGVKLSVGQKQRISIARALLKNPDILIFDEPTSALDSLTESLIKETLFVNLRGKTIFIIAHRLSTINNVDKIFVISNGELIQQGTHKELVNNEGLYKKLWSEQSLN